MKGLLIVGTVLVTAVGLADLRIEDGQSGMSLSAQNGACTSEPKPSKIFRFLIIGNAIAKTRDVMISAGEIRGRVGPAKDEPSKSILLSAEAKSKFVIVRKVGAAGAEKRTEIQSPKALYQNREATGEVKVFDRVLITDEDLARKTSVEIIGTSGNATITLSPSGSGHGLLSATIEGPVTVRIKGPKSFAEIHARRLQLDQSRKPAKLTFDGDVRAHGTGSTIVGEVTGSSHIEMELSEAGEVIKLRSGRQSK